MVSQRKIIRFGGAVGAESIVIQIFVMHVPPARYAAGPGITCVRWLESVQVHAPTIISPWNLSIILLTVFQRAGKVVRMSEPMSAGQSAYEAWCSGSRQGDD